MRAAPARSQDRIDDIEKITIRTHESAIRIIDKKGPLDNPADRDHCIQYMVAVPLIFGRLTAADYEDDVAADPRIDALREKMVCVEDPQFSRDYLDPDKRSIANAHHASSSRTAARRRRSSSSIRSATAAAARRACPCWSRSSSTNLARRFPAKQQQAILDVALDARRSSTRCRCTSSSI